MSVISFLSQKVGEYLGGGIFQKPSPSLAQDLKDSIGESFRQAGQDLKELVYQGNKDRYWNTAIQGRINGACDIAEADNFQSDEPLVNDLLKSFNTVSGATSFALNAVSNSICDVLRIPNVVEEAMIKKRLPSFDELAVSAQAIPGPYDDMVTYALNRLSGLGKGLRVEAQSSRFVEIIKDTQKIEKSSIATARNSISLLSRINKSGMSTREAKNFFGWGSEVITKPLAAFTQESLLEAGWTKEVLLDVSEGYRELARLTPNKSAALRAEQLEKLAELLK